MKRETNTIVQADLKARYAEVRSATESLARGLSAEDCALQSMPDASPVKTGAGTVTNGRNSRCMACSRSTRRARPAT